MSDKRRVVITGLGWITPLGFDLEGVWKEMLEGRSGVGYISYFDATGFPTRIGGEVHDLDRATLPPGFNGEHMGRNALFAVSAANLAVKNAGLQTDAITPERFGVYLGSGEGEMDFFNFVDLLASAWRDGRVDNSLFLDRGQRLLHPIREAEQRPFMPASHIAAIFNARGPNSNCLTACAASSQAIGEATEVIRRGDADVMITGGTHSMIHPFGLAGFNLLTALSTQNENPQKASRPFDRLRDGFILGEGAGIIIIEELEHARRRGAPIHCEIVGYGSTGDAFRITDTHPQGRGAIAAIKCALADAGLSIDDIDYISAHGTSTIVNDKIETLAVKQVFGERAYKVPMSSIKGMIGHLITAAGAVEIITCALAIRDSMLPPTINYEYPDPDCDLDYVPNVARRHRVRAALSNSFGFGGQNITLIAREFNG